MMMVCDGGKDVKIKDQLKYLYIFIIIIIILVITLFKVRGERNYNITKLFWNK